MEGMLAVAALPNLHPALVHFPIAISATALLGALVVHSLVARTADLGGSLVYRHGVAVATARRNATPRTPPAARAPASSKPRRVSRLENGSLVWKPGAEDEGRGARFSSRSDLPRSASHRHPRPLKASPSWCRGARTWLFPAARSFSWTEEEPCGSSRCGSHP